MYYIKAEGKIPKTYEVADTKDGVTEIYTIPQLYHIVYDLGIEIQGVSLKGIKPVNATKKMGTGVVKRVDELLQRSIASCTQDTLHEMARGLSCAREFNKLGDNVEQCRDLIYSKMMTQGVKDVIKKASKCSNSLIEVDINDINAVKNALKNNVCLILQMKTKGGLTAFTGTASMKVCDNLYREDFVETAFLAQRLYELTTNIERIRPQFDIKKEKKPNLLQVVSADIRLRPTRTKTVDVGLKEISSIFYSVNTEMLLGLFILDNPAAAGNTIVAEFLDKTKRQQQKYKFDFDMWVEVSNAFRNGTNIYNNKDEFEKYIDATKLTKVVDVTEAMQQFDDAFGYATWLKQNGYTFN